MSDYERVHETVVVALWSTQESQTVGEAAEVIAPAVLSMMADEAERQARQLGAPPVGQDWPLEDPDPTAREAYLRGWKAASAVLRARAGVLRHAVRDVPVSVS